MEKYVVTLSRQFASMGRAIAEDMSEKLGIEFYDRDIVEATAKRMGQPISVISNEEEIGKVKFYKSLYPLGMGSSNLQDEIFEVQRNIIRDFATRESCIIVGRCGNVVLDDFPRKINIFIYAPYEARLQNCVDIFQMSPKMAAQMIKDIDLARGKYQKRYAKQFKGPFDGYDVMIDSSRFGVEGTSDYLIHLIQSTFKA